ncbi:MAG: energy-coupling factor transporter transmembrane protein EcfT [Clostridiales bacterium]|nr:energy-coupling factor transporter transmembrane protein EcfT [Clostridiales bacterium]
MFRDITLGQYYPANSAVHRLDPRTKILLTIFYIVGVFFIKTYFSYAVTILFLTSVILISKIPVLSVLKSIRGILFLVLFASVLNLFFVSSGEVLFESWITPRWVFRITMDGVHYSIKLTLRLILLVTGASLLTFTTTPVELTDGMESLMSPLKLIKVPVHDIAVIMSIALRFIPTLLDETNKIMNAQKARGASFDTGGIVKRAKALLPILIPLFVSSFRRADELAFAMNARCYNATDKRTKMKELKFSLKDLIALILVLAFLTVVFLDRYYFMGIDSLLFPGVLRCAIL